MRRAITSLPSLILQRGAVQLRAPACAWRPASTDQLHGAGAGSSASPEMVQSAFGYCVQQVKWVVACRGVAEVMVRSQQGAALPTMTSSLCMVHCKLNLAGNTRPRITPGWCSYPRWESQPRGAVLWVRLSTEFGRWLTAAPCRSSGGRSLRSELSTLRPL